MLTVLVLQPTTAQSCLYLPFKSIFKFYTYSFKQKQNNLKNQKKIVKNKIAQNKKVARKIRTLRLKLRKISQPPYRQKTNGNPHHRRTKSDNMNNIKLSREEYIKNDPQIFNYIPYEQWLSKNSNKKLYEKYKQLYKKLKNKNPV